MAATHFESRFGEGLTRFVRRVVWTSRGTGSLAEFVLNAVRMVREQLGLERDELISELTGRIFAEITGQGIAEGSTPCPLPIDRPFAFRSVVDLSFAIKKDKWRIELLSAVCARWLILPMSGSRVVQIHYQRPQTNRPESDYNPRFCCQMLVQEDSGHFAGC